LPNDEKSIPRDELSACSCQDHDLIRPILGNPIEGVDEVGSQVRSAEPFRKAKVVLNTRSAASLAPDRETLYLEYCAGTSRQGDASRVLDADQTIQWPDQAGDADRCPKRSGVESD